MKPLTVICGYLGSGKTTLINHILKSTSFPIGILVNDFGELNIDKYLIENEDELTISLTNGCVCCNLNDDLGDSLNFMLSQKVKAVILESSGVALPVKMSNYGTSWPGYKLSKLLTVVEGGTLKQLLSDKFVSKTVKSQIIQSDLVYINRYNDFDLELLSSMNPDYKKEEELDALLENIFIETDTVGEILPFVEEHNSLKTEVLLFDGPINQEDILNFLDINPGIERLKGWISDSENQSWLVQVTRSERDFTVSKYQTTSRLVVIYKKDLNKKFLYK